MIVNRGKLILKLILPLQVFLGSKKYIINLNNYHLWYRYNRNKIKQEYQNLIANQIKGSTNKIIDLVLTLHRPDKRKVDRANALCLHEKYTCDALVKNGFIEDDNDSFVGSTLYLTGEKDKENPRVEMLIFERD